MCWDPEKLTFYRLSRITCMYHIYYLFIFVYEYGYAKDIIAVFTSLPIIGQNIFYSRLFRLRISCTAPNYLHSIFALFQFEISSLTNLIFSIFQTWILTATAGRKIQFKLGKNPVQTGKNPVHQTG